jgi:hypothetical protein
MRYSTTGRVVRLSLAGIFLVGAAHRAYSDTLPVVTLSVDKKVFDVGDETTVSVTLTRVGKRPAKLVSADSTITYSRFALCTRPPGSGSKPTDLLCDLLFRSDSEPPPDFVGQPSVTHVFTQKLKFPPSPTLPDVWLVVYMRYGLSSGQIVRLSQAQHFVFKCSQSEPGGKTGLVVCRYYDAASLVPKNERPH